MKKLIIVDISSFIFRAFYAVRPLHAADGKPVNAVYGVLSMLFKLIEKNGPSHIVLAQDLKEESFRKTKFPAYKANRSSPPDDLKVQFDIINELFSLMKIPTLSKVGFEADDIIGTLVHKFSDSFEQIEIISGDKDLMQFVSEKVYLLDTMKDKIYRTEDVKEKMGVYPCEIVDYLSLVGDASDNIPGVKGVGPKGAAKLIETYKTLENCLEHVHEITNGKVKEAILMHKENALLSKELVQIVTDIPLNVEAQDLYFEFKSSVDFNHFLQKLNFNSFIKKIETYEQIDILSASPESEEALDIIDSVEKLNQLKGDIFSISFDKDLFLADDLVQAQILFNNSFTSNDLEIFLKNKYLIGYQMISLFRDFNLNDVNYFDTSLAFFALHPDAKQEWDFLLDKIYPQGTKGRYSQIKNLSLVQDILKKKLIENSLLELVQNVDQPLVRIIALMERQGILLDLNVLKNIEKDFSSELNQIEEIIKAVHGGEINIRSPKQVGEFLFGKLGLPVIRKTKTGYSTDVDVLEELRGMNISDIPGLLLNFREVDKLLSTYVMALPTFLNPKSHRIHPHFHLTKAATGRLACDQPNVQNIPVRTLKGRKIRQAFVAEKGHILLAVDYSQIELRLLAHLAEDPVMLEAFNKDLDIHQQTASEIFQVPLEDVTKDQRSAAKAINFGLMYGQSSFGLSQQLKIPRHEAQQYIDFYFKRFYRVKQYLEELKALALEKGYSETMLGRKRWIPAIRSSNKMEKAAAERVAINTPIQGSAADIIKLSMIQVDSLLKDYKCKMLLQVHDELIFEMPLNEIDHLTPQIIDIMQKVQPLSIPLKVESKKGLNWLEMS